MKVSNESGLEFEQKSPWRDGVYALRHLTLDEAEGSFDLRHYHHFGIAEVALSIFSMASIRQHIRANIVNRRDCILHYVLLFGVWSQHSGERFMPLS
jgi:hypothetical protein